MLAFTILGSKPSYGYGSNLTAGQWLYPGQQLTSPNSVFTFVMQTDGNLVLYHRADSGNGVPLRPLWASDLLP